MRQTALKPSKRGDIARTLGKRQDGTPEKFTLGKDRGEAIRRFVAITALWLDIEARAKKRDIKPYWDEPTRLAAKAIARGQSATLPSLPPTTGNFFAEYPTNYVERVARLRAAGATIEPEPDKYATGMDEFRADLAVAQQSLATVIGSDSAIGITLDQVLDRYAKKLDDATTPVGKSAWQKGKADLADSLKFYLAKWLPLDMGQIDKDACDAMIQHIADRPHTRKKTFLAQKSARHLVWFCRKFLTWIDEAKDIPWELPPKFRLDKRVKYRDLDETEIKRGVITIPMDHLKRVIAVASERQKLYIGLALNCAYGSDQLGRLQIQWLDIEAATIQGYRLKKQTESNHYYWKCNIERLRSIIGKRTKGTIFLSPKGNPLYRTHPVSGNGIDGFGKAWEKLVDKIRQTDETFPKYSFGKVRKTAATLALQISDPHIASMLLAHKTISDDKLLEAYAGLPFDKLYETQKQLEAKLVADLGL